MIRRAQPWLGTLVEISVAQPAAPAPPAATDRAIAAAFAAIARVHRCMSFHAADSDVAAINALTVGAQHAVDAHTGAVLRCALLLQQASNGLFDIACADALSAWGQLPAVTHPAGIAGGAAQADDTGNRCGDPGGRAVLAIDDDNRVTRLRPGAIDLGGIAKGHAVDLAIAALQDAGVESAAVNAGGDLRTFGPAGLQVAIRDPAHAGRAGRMLHLRDTALATSAGYFSRRHVDGVDSSALLDPLRGQPVLHGRSASVLAPTCMLADGLTKPVIISADPGLALLARFGATALLL